MGKAGRRGGGKSLNKTMGVFDRKTSSRVKRMGVFRVGARQGRRTHRLGPRKGGKLWGSLKREDALSTQTVKPGARDKKNRKGKVKRSKL